MQKIGFIGTGVMGTAMITNLLKAGYDVTVYNRTKAHAKTALENGAKWADSPALLTAQSNVVITIVGYPKDVEEIYFGDNGIFSTAHAGQTVIDMTTSTPTLAQTIAKYALAHDINVLDAPVSGGDVGAKNATLSIMVGGHEETFTAMQPILSAMGKNTTLFGAAGAGQHTKMANQIMIAATMVGLSETLVYAKTANLDLAKVLTTVGNGSGDNWSLDNYGPRILKGDFKPGFYAKHLLKDLRIALDGAKTMHINLPGTKVAEELYTKLSDEKNLGNEGVQALIKLWSTFA